MMTQYVGMNKATLVMYSKKIITKRALSRMTLLTQQVISAMLGLDVVVMNFVSGAELIFL